MGREKKVLQGGGTMDAPDGEDQAGCGWGEEGVRGSS